MAFAIVLVSAYRSDQYTYWYCSRSSVGLEHLPSKQSVPRSNRGGSTNNL